MHSNLIKKSIKIVIIRQAKEHFCTLYTAKTTPNAEKNSHTMLKTNNTEV